MTKIETEVRGKVMTIETGVLARQADGSTVLRYGDTVILSTVVSNKVPREGIDFFPLTVDYQEKTYSAGKIPGGFFKREGRPSEKEILTSRLIDRPIRPIFPKGFRCETQAIVNVLSFGGENTSDFMGITGISAALMISDIPFDGPVSGMRVGMINGEIILCPDLTEIGELDMEIIVAGTDDAVVMIEGRGNEVSEKDFLDAIDKAHAEIKRMNATQRDLAAKCGKTKRAVVVVKADEVLENEVAAYATERVMQATAIPDKLKRQEALDIILAEAKAHFSPEDQHDPKKAKQVADIFFELERKLVRRAIIEQGIRADGRDSETIRQITSTIGLLPRVHGSALFQRGETQALVVATLGTGDDEQKIDALEGEYYKSFMLHYNFPPFSVGEARSLRGPGRREIGHGALAEKGIKPILPNKEEFPYTIRIVSDILESNGSSSMATVCGTSLALMDAGVPIKAPVAGIAMGLIKEGDKTVVLTDILGLEDHLGDMDFKVTGTAKGVTAFQMDSKIGGIDRSIMEAALDQARRGRLFILDRMAECISAPKTTLSPYAPRIFTMTIKQDKIREVIGPGGKVIKGIIEETGVKINIDDSGLISIASIDEVAAQKAIKIIEGIIAEPELNKVYDGKVVRITDFGAFVEIMPGTDGLLHISQIDTKRVERVTDVLQEGDMVMVKVIEIDKTGRIRLSRKELLPGGEGSSSSDQPRGGERRPDRGGERRPDRGGDRGGRR